MRHGNIDAQGDLTGTPVEAGKLITGIYDRTESTLAYDEVSRTVSVTPTGSTFRYYIHGEQFDTGTLSDSHVDSTDGYYFYKDSDDVLTLSTTPWDLKASTVPIAYVFYNSGLTDGFILEARHGSDRNLQAHLEFKNRVGTYWYSGGEATGYVLSPASPADSDNQFDVSATVLYDHDIANTTTAFTAGSAMYILYRSGAAGEWTWATNTVPYLESGANIEWNENTGSTWQRTAAGVNSYVNMWYFAIPEARGARQIIAVIGQNQYSSSSTAKAATFFEDVDVGDFPFIYGSLLHRASFRTSAAYSNTGKCRIEYFEDLRGNTTFGTILGTGTTISHNALAGLEQAGTDVVWGHLNNSTQSIDGDKTFTGSTLTETQIQVGTNTLSAATYAVKAEGDDAYDPSISSFCAGTAGPSLVTAHALGTIASPSVVTTGTDIGEHIFLGYDGTGFTPGARIVSYTTENWSGSALGSKFVIDTVTAGTTSFAECASFQNGSVVAGDGDPDGIGKLTIRGINASATQSASIGCYTDADAYPVAQLWGYSHDNVAMYFDSYYSLGEYASDATCFSFRKRSDDFRLNAAFNQTPGAAVTWTIPLRVIESEVHLNQFADGYSFIFNEGGEAGPVARFEGDTSTHLLYIETTTNRVGVNQSTPAVELDVNGEIFASGNIGAGTAATPAFRLDIEDNFTAISAHKYAGRIFLYSDTTGDDAFDRVAQYNVLAHNGSSNLTGTIAGSLNEVVLNGGAGNIDTITGVISEIVKGSGASTLTNAVAYSLIAQGTITNHYGFDISDDYLTGTNLNVRVDTGSLDPWFIPLTTSDFTANDEGILYNDTTNGVQVSSTVFHNSGNIGINTSAPAADLHVNGKVLISSEATREWGDVDLQMTTAPFSRTVTLHDDLTTLDYIFSAFGRRNGSGFGAGMILSSNRSSTTAADPTFYFCNYDDNYATGTSKTGLLASIKGRGAAGDPNTGGYLEFYVSTDGLAETLALTCDNSADVVVANDLYVTNDAILSSGSYLQFVSTDDSILFDGTNLTFYTDAGSKLSLRTSEVVINDAGADIDLRVESDTITSFLRTDAANNYFGVGGAPSYRFHVQSDVSASAIISYIEDTTNTNQLVTASSATGMDLYLQNDAQFALGQNGEADLLFDTSDIILNYNQNVKTIKFYMSTGATSFQVNNAGTVLMPNLGSGAGDADMRYNTSTGELTYDTSALKYKENIRDEADTSWILDLKVVTYDRKDRSRMNEVGIIADQVAEIRPEYAAYNKDGEVEAYSKSQLVPLLLAEIQKLRQEVDEVKACLV